MLALPKKKKIIRIIIVIAALVQALLDNSAVDSAQERCLRLVGQAEYLLDGFDDNEANWTTDQTALWTLTNTIWAAHEPDVLEEPDTADYEQWVTDLENALEKV